MPFDIGKDTDPQLRSMLTVETTGSEFVPDVGHVDDNLVLLADGSLMAIIQVPGYPFELEGMRTRNIRRRQLNDLFLGIADNNVTLGTHLVHHWHVPARPFGTFHSKIAEGIVRKHTANCLNGKMISNDWFLTVLVAPRFAPIRHIRRHIARFLGKPPDHASRAMLNQMTSITRNLMSYLGPDGARQLSLREEPASYEMFPYADVAPVSMLFSEIAEARQLMLTARWRAIPLTNGLLGNAIYTDRATCGTRLLRFDHLDGPRFGKTLAIRDYPAGEKDETTGEISGGTYTGQFSHFVRLPEQFPFVISQTFRFQSRNESETRLHFKHVRMGNALSVENRGMAGLDAAREDVMSAQTVRGHHNFGLTVFGDTPEDVRQAASIAGAAMIRAGTVPIAEDGNSFGAYWSGLPGQPEWLEGRSGSISSRNLTAFVTFEGFPVGAKEGFWGPSILRFRTSGDTAFDYVTHVGDVGHTWFIGHTSAGKTLLMTLLLCAMEQVTSRGRGTVIFFDKGKGAEPIARATGGTCLTLHAGEASGMSPLRGLANTPHNRAFLEDWIAKLMLHDERGPLQTHTIGMLRRGVARQMQLPVDQRSLGGVRAFLGYGAGSDGERLDRWCRDGALGWLFDGESDVIKLNAHFVNIDMTQLLTHHACPFVGAYLVHRVRELIDGRRLTVVCDEIRAYLLTSTFSAMIEDFSIALRKQNGQLWLASQEPSHITGSPVGDTLAGQMQTIFAFPSSDADPAQFIDKLGFSVPAFRALTEVMPTLPYRTVLMHRESGSAILRTELTDMVDEITLLSGRDEVTKHIPAIVAKVGNDPEAFAAEYLKHARGVL